MEALAEYWLSLQTFRINKTDGSKSLVATWILDGAVDEELKPV